MLSCQIDSFEVNCNIGTNQRSNEPLGEALSFDWSAFDSLT